MKKIIITKIKRKNKPKGSLPKRFIFQSPVLKSVLKTIVAPIKPTSKQRLLLLAIHSLKKQKKKEAQFLCLQEKIWIVSILKRNKVYKYRISKKKKMKGKKKKTKDKKKKMKDKKKISKKKLYSFLKKKNKNLIFKLKPYLKNMHNYKRFAHNVSRKKKLLLIKKKVYLTKIKLFLQLWILKIFKKNLRLKIIQQEQYQSEKKWIDGLQQQDNKNNYYLFSLTTAAIDLNRYFKYNEMLYLCSTELENKKKQQHQLINSYFSVMLKLRPPTIRSFKIQICGKINAVDRRLKFIKTPINKEIGLERYKRDISYHRIQSRCRTGAFGLNIWIEHLIWKKNNKFDDEEQTPTKKN